QSAALTGYQEARKALESLRTRLHTEELKISFVKNRLQVYEALVELYINGQAPQISVDQCFGIMEAAKSRSMLEMIFQSGQSLPLGEAAQNRQEVQRIRDLREELNWYYHRMEMEQLRAEGMSRERLEQLQQLAQSRENELLRALRELPMQDRQSAGLEVPPEFSVAELQAAIPAETALVEYYSAGDRLVAAVVTRENVEIKPLGGMAQVAHRLQLLRFQLSKFRMDARYTQEFEQPLFRATLSHLESLYQEVIEPLRPLLNAQHLVFVPHGQLHFLPFHALRNGDEYVGEAYTVSYAPSATLFALCQQRAPGRKYNSLVIGVPDERAPQIGDELLGLQRGLFYAGASSLLLSLWDVNDRSTAEFMQEFYKGYIRTGDMAVSLQAAMRELKREHPHPYFWAPFVLVGKVAEKQMAPLSAHA